MIINSTLHTVNVECHVDVRVYAHNEYKEEHIHVHVKPRYLET